MPAGDVGARLQTWTCTTDPRTYNDVITEARARLDDAAANARWREVFALLDTNPTENLEAVEANDVPVGGRSGFAPLHHAARHGARTSVVDGLLRRGAWRSLRATSGETPEDVARRRGHDELAETIVVPHEALHDTVLAMEAHFADLIADQAPGPGEVTRMPQLGPLIEFPAHEFYCEIPGMFGGVYYRWVDPRGRDALRADFVSRMDVDGGMHFRVTALAVHGVCRDAI